MLRIKLGNTRTTMITFSKVAGAILLFLGTASLIAAIIVSSSTPALIGLGLIFWGIILTYIQGDEYLKKTILDSTTTTLLTTLNETLETLDYKGKAVYLPPKYVNDPESPKVYMPKQEGEPLPSADITQKLETQSSHRNTQGILITPPGTELAKLIETTLGTSFLRMNLENLQERLPNKLIEDLEVVTDFEIQRVVTEENKKSTESVQASDNEIIVKFTTVAFRETSKRAAELPAIYSNIGCPLSSAIAVAFAKVTGKPVAIKSQHTSEDGQTNETHYVILEERTP
jgi:hypothetical protein